MSFSDGLSDELRELVKHLPAEAARQVPELFGHLPDGEIGDDDPIEFAVLNGKLLVRAGTGSVYSLIEGTTLRYRRHGDGFEVTTFRGGDRIGTATVPATAIDPGIAAAFN
jgi:hypothetical protein